MCCTLMDISITGCDKMCYDDNKNQWTSHLWYRNDGLVPRFQAPLHVK